MHLFDAVIRLSRAVIRLFEACCSAGWPSPAWDRVTVHIPACLFFAFFSLPPARPAAASQRQRSFPLPATPPIRLCAEANPEGRMSYTKPRCQPL
jgi:hypothetical protein